MYSTLDTRLKDQENKRLVRDSKYGIPTFSSLFAYYVNPFGNDKSLGDKWMNWMFRFSLLPRDHFERRIRQAGEMTIRYFYPFCKDIYRYERIVKYTTYLFICDDQVETEYGQHGRNKSAATRDMLHQTQQCIKRLEDIYVNDADKHHISMLDSQPYIMHTYFVVEEILLGMNVEQRKRLLNSWKSYCQANEMENEIIGKQILDFGLLKKVRLETGGLRMSIALIDYSHNILIPDKIWNDDKIQRLMDLCNLCAGFTNDVYSFEKEYLEQNYDMKKMITTIVGFHVMHDNCTIEEAFTKSLDIVKQIEFEFKELADTLSAETSAETKTFVENLAAIMGGNFALSIYGSRYNNIYIA